MTDQANEREGAGADPGGSEERLRLILENVRDHAIFLTDPNGRVVEWGDGAAAAFGFAADEIVGEPDSVLFTPEDRAAGIPEQERATAVSEGRAPDQRWHLRKDGSRVFIDGVSTALRRAPGSEIIGFLKIGRDATEAQTAEQRQRLLLAELQHRVRNTLAVVRSIARRTAATSVDVDEMAAHLDGRIGAFARVQAVVTRDPAGKVGLTAMIEDELLAHATQEGDRLAFEGPEISLLPKAAEAFSLAVHELAANAVKHGALGSASGKVRISWSRVPGKDGERLLFAWEEIGGDTPLPERGPTGFGFDLLEEYLPYELDAETRVELDEKGLKFTLDMPVEGKVA